MPAPIYTRDNCTFACPLQWGLTVFWRTPPGRDDWVSALTTALEDDGIRLLGHRFESPAVSQFALSTLPQVPPLLLVQRVKGRLQYLVRDEWPKPFRGNYALRSFGKVTRDVVENYVAGQVDHHPMADPRVDERLRRYQVVNEDIDLSLPQRTSQGLFWHNLHVVLVHRERWMEIREDVLRGVRDMIVGASRAKRYLLSRAGILPDHVHLTLGCPFDVAPLDVALGFLNNLAFIHGMKPMFQYGGFVGTFGEYDSRAVASETAPRRGKFAGGAIGQAVWSPNRAPAG
jgi:REP element-mobilizing transposase RayT